MRAADASGLSPSTYGLLLLSVIAALGLQTVTGVWIRSSPPQWIEPIVMLAGAASFRHRPRFRTILAVIAVLTLQIYTTSALTYSTQSFCLPLRDELFSAIDHTFGFDWLRFQAFMVERNGVMAVLSLSYQTFFKQIVLAPILLVFWGEVRRSDRFVSSFLICALLTVFTSALLPAEGGASLAGADEAHLLFQGATPLGTLHALRDGSLRAVPLEEVGPVISFPSLHCAVAYLVTAALWPLGTLRWVTLLLNGVMTPLGRDPRRPLRERLHRRPVRRCRLVPNRRMAGAVEREEARRVARRGDAAGDGRCVRGPQP